MAGELFGLEFAPAAGVPVYHPDVRAYAVTERATGRQLGLWYVDPYARPGKYNGGMTDVYRIHEGFRGEVTALVANYTPFVKPAPGAPALLGLRDAQTMFHEFGHALHNLLSNVSYPAISGGRVVNDYQEFPGRLFEKWLMTPEMLGRFARHYQTGEPMPAALIEKIQRAATFNQGFETVSYLTSALIEMKLHLAGAGAIDPDKFERETLAQLGAPEEIAPISRMSHFTHVFANDSYSAGYYRYLWADALAADAFEAFSETGRNFDKTVAARLRDHVLSVGNSVDPFDGYRAFRTRDATVDALMRARGFAVRPQPTK
jgi:peptidyl-dipeptidase Dcp